MSRKLHPRTYRKLHNYSILSTDYDGQRKSIDMTLKNEYEKTEYRDNFFVYRNNKIRSCVAQNEKKKKYHFQILQGR